MPLNLTVHDGDFTPFMKYKATAGRWYIREDGRDGDQEVMNPTLAFDMAGIKTGWIYYPPAGSGGSPEKVWDPSASIVATKPTGEKKFLRGFEVIVYGDPRTNGGRNIGLREFSSTAGVTIGPILKMYEEYEIGLAANVGKVPVFACSGVVPVVGSRSTNYSPQFKLQSWVPRASIPFDGGGPSSNGHAAPVWAFAEAVAAAAPHGITREALIAGFKSRGLTKWEPARDTATVQQLIRDAQALRREPGDEPFDTLPPGEEFA